MYHRFIPQEIPQGKKFVIEFCVCGAASRRYTEGRFYEQTDGTYGKKPLACTRTQSLSADEVRRAGEDLAETIELPLQLPARSEGRRFDIGKLALPTKIGRAVVTNNRLTPIESQLLDAYIILNIMFEDMVSAGVRTQGREMAGRLLYSAGYQKALKEIES